MNKAVERLKRVNLFVHTISNTVAGAKENLGTDDFRLFSVMVLHSLIKDEDADAAKQYETFIEMMKGAMIAEELDAVVTESIGEN